MAGGAGHLFVLAGQLEIGVLVMIELDFLPACFRVAFLAFITLPATVGVIMFMAGYTTGLDFHFVRIFLVTLHAT